MAITAAELQVKVGWDDSEVERGSRATQDKISKTGDLLKTGAVALGTAAVASGGTAVASFMSIQDAMAPIGTLLGFQSDEFNRYTDNVKKLIAASPQSADEIGRGAYDILSAGIMDVDAATVALTASQKLAAAGLGQVPDAVDVITSSMNAFKNENLSGADAAKILFGTMSIGKADLNTIAQGFGGIAPMAAQAGISFQEMMASVAAMTQTGLPASEVYTGLKATISNVIKPTKEAADVAKDLGLQFDAQALKTKGLSGFLDDVKQKTGGSSETMAKLFGSVEALNYVMALTGDQSETFKSSIDGVVTSGETLDDAAKGINGTLSNQFAILKNHGKVAMAELAEKGIKVVGEMWERYGPQILSVIAELKGGFRALASAFMSPDEGITSNGFAGAMERIGIASRRVIDFAIENWPKFWSVIVTAFNAVRNAISAAIAYWPTIQSTLGPIINSVRDAFSNIVPGVVLAFQTVIDIGRQVVGFFHEHWPEISNVLQQVVNTIGPILEFIGILFKRVIQVISFLWRTWGDDLLAVVGFLFDHLVPIIEGALKIIQGIFKFFADLLKGDWGALWGDVKLIFDGAWGIISGALDLAWDGLKNIVGKALDAALFAIQGGWNTITGWISGAVSGVSSLFSGMFDGIAWALKSAVNWMIDIWNSIPDFEIPGFDPPGPGPSFGGFSIGLPKLGHLAMGGDVTGGGIFRVGERGPENVFLPAGSSVQSNGSPAGIMVGNVTLPSVTNAEQFIAELRRWQRTNGPIPISVTG